MPIGTSDGNVYEDDMHHALDIPMFPQSTEELKKSSGYNPAEDTYTAHIFRHGDIDLETNHGWSPAPLNEEGQKHAEKAANTASSLPLHALYTSDLPRTVQTADAIANKTAMQPIPTEALRTWDLGAYTGKTDEASKEAVKRLCSTALNENPPPGDGYSGESFNDFKDRIIGAVGGILSQHPNQEVGLVTHNSVEKVLRAWDASGQLPNGKLDMNEFAKENIQPGGHKSMDLDAQAAREVASQRIQRSVGPSPTQPREIPEHLQTMYNYFLHAGGQIKDTAMDLLHHPENIVGTGEIGGMFLAPADTFKGWAKTQLAELMENKGVSALSIKQKTGLERGPEGKWREEISDMPGTIRHSNVKSDTGKDRTLGDIYDHPELYKRYPELANLPVKISSDVHTGALHSTYNSTVGHYMPAHMELNPRMIKKWAEEAGVPYQDVLKSTISHELQHAIQYMEGFAVASPETFVQGFKNFAIKEFVKDWVKNPESFNQFAKFYNDYVGKNDLRTDLTGNFMYSRNMLNQLADWYFYIQQGGEPEAMNVERRLRMERAGTLNLRNSLAEETNISPFNEQLMSAQMANIQGFGPKNKTIVVSNFDKDFAYTQKEGQTVKTPDRSPYGPIPPNQKRLKEIDPEHIKELLSLPNVTLAEVANALEISRTTLKSKMKQAGIEAPVYDRSRTSGELRSKIENFIKQGLTDPEIAKELNIARETSRNVRRRMGNPPGPSYTPFTKKRELTPRNPDYDRKEFNYPDWFLDEMKK